jgi:hypothetical protein
LSGILKTLKAINVILLVGFLVSALGMGAVFVLNSVTLKNVDKNVDQLKAKVIVLESSEQQLILMKDRLSKIASIKAFPSTLTNITNINSMLTGLSGNSSISQMDMGLSKVDLSMIIKSNDDLSMFLTNVKNTNLFKSVTLSSFGYSPAGGYNIGTSFVGK